jgi:hypothetical protein
VIHASSSEVNASARASAGQLPILQLKRGMIRDEDRVINSRKRQNEQLTV